MKQLLIILFHPADIIRKRERVPIFLIHLSVAGFACVLGLAFQFLYPRLLNNVPWLGFLRKLSVENWNPGFNMDYFLRGTAMGIWFVLVLLVVFIPMHQVGRVPGKCFQISYLAALASAIPLLIACAAGLLLFSMHLTLGLFPIYGFIASTCLQATLMRELFGIPRFIVIYLAPFILAVQAYGCYRLLP